MRTTGGTPLVYTICLRTSAFQVTLERLFSQCPFSGTLLFPRTCMRLLRAIHAGYAQTLLITLITRIMVRHMLYYCCLFVHICDLIRGKVSYYLLSVFPYIQRRTYIVTVYCILGHVGRSVTVLPGSNSTYVHCVSKPFPQYSQNTYVQQ